MTIIRNKYYLLNFPFLACLLTLFFNDHYLKYQLSNWVTGKLSDVTGIVILPLLLAYLFPKIKQHATWISALLFVFWKSPFSQDAIDFYNSFSFIQTARTVDITDLAVLLLLPLPHLMIKRITTLNLLKLDKVNPLLILFPTIFTLLATSPPPRHYYTRTQGNLACYGCHITVRYNQEDIVKRLQNFNIVFDSIALIDKAALERVPALKKENARSYRLNQLIIDKDTLKNLDFTMRTLKSGETKIYFNGMHVPDDISTIKLQIKLRKQYKMILFKELNRLLKQ